jgi:hypothetical protein
LRVSSALVCTLATSGRPTTKRSASFACIGLAMVDMRAKSVAPRW